MSPRHRADEMPQTLPDIDPAAALVDFSGHNDAEPAFDQGVYDQKVTFLETTLQEQTDSKLAAQRTKFMQAVGGYREAERIDLWESVKQGLASQASREVGDSLMETVIDTAKPAAERDVFERAFTAVRLDHYGSTDRQRLLAGPDVTDFNVGSGLADLTQTGELQDPAILAKATDTIRLLTAYGRYKFCRWGNGDQLRTALDLIATYAEQVPGFNPDDAGFDEAERSLTLSLAALQVDRTSKPNYTYAKPERGYLFGQTADGLKKLRTTEAHMYLRYQDVELPQPVTDPLQTDSNPV